MPNQVFIDIGSNRGEAITSMTSVANFENIIFGFEPNPLIFNKLKNNFNGNNRIKLNNYGLGDKNQELALYIPFYRNWMFDGLSSLKYEAAEGWLRTRLWKFNENKQHIKKVSCQVRKLDDFDLDPYFIKIDVQGFEYEVLQGGINTIKTHKPILLIESITSDVKNLLEAFDYKFFRYQKGELIKGEGVLNTFCMTHDKHAEIISK